MPESRTTQDARGWYPRELAIAAGVDTTTDAVIPGVVKELIDAGDNVIAVMHVRARGRQSEVPVERRESHVWTLRDGKLWRLRVYATKQEALEAVGLSEQDAHAESS